MAKTKSNSPSKRKGKDTAGQRAEPAETVKPTLASVTKDKKQMSEVASIIEYSEDISTAEAPAPLPVGDYPAEIRGAERKEGPKAAYAAVTFFIAPEAYPADYTEGNPDGTTLVYRRVPIDDSPAGRHRMRKFCEAIGASTGSKVDLNSWIGLSATVAVDHSEFEGETRAEVKKVVAA
jgi:hypothetical protein